MDLWKSRDSEFANSQFYCTRYWGALPSSSADKGCYHCKNLRIIFLNISLCNVAFHLKILCILFYPSFIHEKRVQVSKMLKPEKWQATFDSDGKLFGFQKALRLIVLGVCYLIVLQLTSFPFSLYQLNYALTTSKQNEVLNDQTAHLQTRKLVCNCELYSQSLNILNYSVS